MTNSEFKIYLPLFISLGIVVAIFVTLIYLFGPKNDIGISESFNDNKIQGIIWPQRIRPLVFAISKMDGDTTFYTAMDRPQMTEETELFLDQNLTKGDSMVKEAKSDSVFVYKKSTTKNSYLLILSKRKAIKIN